MSLFLRQQSRDLGDTASQLVPSRVRGQVYRTTPDEAMRHSAVWAATRLRADLISSLPVDVYSLRNGVQVLEPIVPSLVKPGALLIGGQATDMHEWLYATQVDLDRCGNSYGIITGRGIDNTPTRIDLVPFGSVTVRARNGEISYAIDGKHFAATDIWHERQYVVAGMAVGLSPIAYAAMAIGGYANAQQFAVQWFSGTSQPAGKLKNNAMTLDAKQAAEVKMRYKATVASGDVLVVGKDWDYEMGTVAQAQSEFISAQQFSIADVARFMGVPGDMIDAESSTGSITYASITQRNVQLLVMHLGPAIARRERALSGLIADPRFVKLNADALLRMDPYTAAQVLETQIKARYVTPDEARTLANREPLTEADYAQFDRLFTTIRQTYTGQIPGTEPSDGGNA